LENQKCNCFDKKRRGVRKNKCITSSVREQGKKQTFRDVKEKKIPFEGCDGITIVFFPHFPASSTLHSNSIASQM